MIPFDQELLDSRFHLHSFFLTYQPYVCEEKNEFSLLLTNSTSSSNPWRWTNYYEVLKAYFRKGLCVAS